MENLTVILYFSGCSIGRECVIAKTIVTESATLCPRAYSGRCVCVPGCVHHQKFIPQGYLKYEGRCSYCKCFPDGRVSLSLCPRFYFKLFFFWSYKKNKRKYTRGARARGDLWDWWYIQIIVVYKKMVFWVIILSFNEEHWYARQNLSEKYFWTLIKVLIWYVHVYNF